MRSNWEGSCCVLTKADLLQCVSRISVVTTSADDWMPRRVRAFSAVKPKLSLKYNQQDATFFRSIYFYKLLYMFYAVPPPIIRSTKLYIQRQVLSNQYCCLLLSWMRWNFYRFQAVPSPIIRSTKLHTTSGIVKLRSISSTIAAGSSIGLTIPDAVCTVLCS